MIEGLNGQIPVFVKPSAIVAGAILSIACFNKTGNFALPTLTAVFRYPRLDSVLV
jgi:hypothetical protein